MSTRRTTSSKDLFTPLSDPDAAFHVANAEKRRLKAARSEETAAINVPAETRAESTASIKEPAELPLHASQPISRPSMPITASLPNPPTVFPPPSPFLTLSTMQTASTSVSLLLLQSQADLKYFHK
ncbi:hypothetical protein PGTUg99_033521 [Puccinia graminis f. sp. tritici]|uniref:Uncharacterized protein n=1 Tax=Puccinia graminis f. sp. tritici TaxID=56615 RepID=A0A5B0PQ84_PUCGR|nr:hypothetical protein PGTUg99_033521 [Puccinia graminis f. sp. tritici]